MQLFRFENEYQAIEALNNIRKKLKQQRGLNAVRRLSNFIFWPVAALGFIVSINGACDEYASAGTATAGKLVCSRAGSAAACHCAGAAAGSGST
ncbi:hypothetical protein [Klebsiella pneumoniae]|uniref:hypothetical protein n=1 Tax=Klebsiella pneumoniae TaxID=573 RepID=UPI001D17FE5E|nr:hypothetical protein [Klebsiella pneumoniae]